MCYAFTSTYGTENDTCTSSTAFSSGWYKLHFICLFSVTCWGYQSKWEILFRWIFKSEFYRMPGNWNWIESCRAFKCFHRKDIVCDSCGVTLLGGSGGRLPQKTLKNSMSSQGVFSFILSRNVTFFNLKSRLVCHRILQIERLARFFFPLAHCAVLYFFSFLMLCRNFFFGNCPPPPPYPPKK